MAIIFAVVGGGVLIGGALATYEDYSDYSNYSEYSDASERRKRRLEQKQNEIENLKYEINTYKTDSINSYLKNKALISQDGVNVNLNLVKNDGNEKINDDIRNNILKECGMYQEEIKIIDDLIEKIDSKLNDQ